MSLHYLGKHEPPWNSVFSVMPHTVSRKRNGYARNNICKLYLIIRPYCLQKLLKLIDEYRRYSKPKQCPFETIALPCRISNCAVWMDAIASVRCRVGMFRWVLLVRKVDVRQPELIDDIVGYVYRHICLWRVEAELWIGPRLTKVDIDTKLLTNTQPKLQKPLPLPLKHCCQCCTCCCLMLYNYH